MKHARVVLATFAMAALAVTTFPKRPIDVAGLKSVWFSARVAAAPSLLTRGPYLQMGTSSSVVVRWRTSALSDSQVVYGPDPSSLIWAATLASPTTEHEVTVSGLLPSTKFYYAVGSTAQRLAGGDVNHFFVTAPLAGTATPTRVWVLGDSGTADANAASVRNAYYSFTGSTNTNLWLMLGDNAYNAGLDAEYQTAVFDMYPNTLRQSVLWPTVGNHDIANSAAGTGPYYGMFTLPKNGEAGGLASGTEAYYSFDYANIHFICLDSFDVDRSTTGPMMTWLRNDLASTTERWIVAFWHHPPYSKGSHDSDIDFELTEMRENALPILEAGGVDLVLSGHSHSYERSFLIDGHYGQSSTFSGSMKKDAGSGRENGTGAYRKPANGSAPHAGAVYTVAGSSGFAGGGALNHSAMYISLNVLGSLVLDVNDGRLDARFIDNTSAVRDYFTIVKGPAVSIVPDVFNRTQAAATAALTGAGLTIGRVDNAPSSSVPAGSVISQSVTAGTQVPAGSPVGLVVSTGVIVPSVVGQTQADATTLITAVVGLSVGAVTTAPSGTVAAGLVISQNPAGNTHVSGGTNIALVVSSGFTVATSPVVVGSQIAGTFADATGHSAQSHLVYAANAGVWWLFTLTSAADAPGGTNHIVKAYRSSGSDLATATWTAASDSPGASTSASANCNSCFMGGGRALSVAYVNNAPTDAVHAEVAMASNGQNGLTAHIRAKVTATSITWESWNYHDEPAASWTLPRAVTLGVSTGKYIHSGGPTLQQEVDANARRSSNPDTGATWTTGFSSVSVIDNSMIHQNNAMAFAPLANNAMLAVYDNGGGVSTCFNCGQTGVPEPNLSNLGYKKSNSDGSWPGVQVASQGPGDGQVFSTDATIDQNDWALVAPSTTTIRAFRRNAGGTGIDAAGYNAAPNTWAGVAAPPVFGAGQSFKNRAGLFGTTDGSSTWLFVINTDAANSILFSKYDGTTWTAWATVPGTASGAQSRNFISGSGGVSAGKLGLIWTEGTSSYSVVTTSISTTPPTVPNVVNLPQAAATTAITNAGLIVGAVTTASSASVAAGSVVSQNPSAGTQVAAGSAISFVVALATMPNLVTLTQAAATTAITNVGLVVGTVTAAASSTLPIGSVISSNPGAGTQVAAGSAVNLVVSTGVTVPAVVGQTQEAATALITGVGGLSVGAVTTASSATVTAGLVISQNPAGNTHVSGGTSVALVVSFGPPPATVPSVVNLAQVAATTAITNAGLTVGAVTTASSATVAAGSVISQDPSAGTQVAAGSAVSFVVALATVPNVVGVTQAAATTSITNAGLVVGTVTSAASSTVPIGSVINQSVAAGSQVPAGSAVGLVVSTGVTVPSVVGQTQAAATTLITSVAGLSVGAVTTASSTTVAAGLVISQNPAGNTHVSGGTSVALVVSSGPPPATVPNVVNLTQVAATTAITNAGLVVGTVTSAASAPVPIGSVISSNPIAGTLVTAGSAVNLVVSTGVTVPSVVGQTQAVATTLITSVGGLSVGAVTTASSTTVAAGLVISQNPAGNTHVSGGTSVALVISSGPPTSLTIWSTSAVPANFATNDGSAVELGVKFRADVAGTVTGVRFYKGATTTGTHTGTLWSSTGTKLATATFTGESASGWQQVTFSSPIAITANTVYVVSYHTNVGSYAYSAAYFASAGVDKATLHALANGVSGGNGVYRYGASAFPNSTFNSNNYWVDVVFVPQ